MTYYLFTKYKLEKKKCFNLKILFIWRVQHFTLSATMYCCSTPSAKGIGDTEGQNIGTLPMCSSESHQESTVIVRILRITKTMCWVFSLTLSRQSCLLQPMLHTRSLCSPLPARKPWKMDSGLKISTYQKSIYESQIILVFYSQEPHLYSEKQLG